MSNILMEQYAIVKKDVLRQSPFMCLNNRKIQKNPHQIDAFLKGISSINTGGIIFADEVGLGKTIEAGLVLQYMLRTKKDNILIVTPASLRVQWQEELDEKFNIEAKVFDGTDMRDRNRKAYIDKWIHEDKAHVVLVSYRFASVFMTNSKISDIKWDLVVIDEAHNMRNVFNGTKSAKKLYDSSFGIPKLLLTATPLQNSLNDLFGLVSFIDPRIFENEKVFNKKYGIEKRYDELKLELTPVLTRTLRKEVAENMHFAARTCLRFDFTLSQDEKTLYVLVDGFAKNSEYGFPNANKNLCLLVIRKLLASSSFALIDTFQKIKKRLENLKDGTVSKNAENSLDDFFSYLDSDEQEDWNENYELNDENKIIKEKIENEILIVDNILKTAERIKYNSKMKKLIEAVEIALKSQAEKNYEQKVVIFTESLRTQKYIYDSLISYGFDSDDIVIFNGNRNDTHSKKIFNAWRALNSTNNNPLSIQFKHAMVDYFKKNGKIFISTDSGAEGLNLQFSNTIINYDLPWNPQKIEQRIGRVHRYGQKHDVVAINFLNTENEADKRVYDILSKKFKLFEGVFGASDEALGLLASDTSFEKTILDIYQSCNSAFEFNKSFDKLDKKIDSKKEKIGKSLKSILQVTSDEEKHNELNNTKKNLKNFFDELYYWHDYDVKKFDGLFFETCKIDFNPFEIIGLDHGYLFIGGLVEKNKCIDSVLMLTDSFGGPISIPEKDLLEVIELIDDETILKWKVSKEEDNLIKKTYDLVTEAAIYKHEKQVQKYKDYNMRKVNNWIENKKELLNIEIQEKQKTIDEMNENANKIMNFYEKVDYKKSIKVQETLLDKMRLSYFDNVKKIEDSAKKDIIEFNKKYEINPIFLVKVVLKF